MDWKRGPTIGHGSSATVSVATTVSGHLFAVKSTDLSTSHPLQKEQHILSKLTSKHIIKYMGFDITYTNNKPMYNLFMEYATGGTIHDMIKTHGGSLDERLIRSYTYQVLLGLDYLHNNNIVHCDIKCRNLLLCEDGVKIGDLGCVKIMQNDVGFKDFKFSGTPVFMSPEVARGEEQGFPADVWAVGCSVIEMVTGFNPWPDINDPVAGLYRIGYSGDMPDIPVCLPEDGKDFLDKCLRKDAKERWTVKMLLQHPFVRNLNSSFETRDSPTSVLDQGFWECLPVLEGSPALTKMVDFSGGSAGERIRQLVEATPSGLGLGLGSGSGLPDWEDGGEWIAVRSNRIEEMDVEDGDFRFSRLDLVDEVEKIERLVVDEDCMSLECFGSSRDLDLDHIVNNVISFCE